MQPQSKPPSFVDVPLPEAPQVGISQLLAWGLNSYTPLMCIFGLLAFLKTYTRQLRSWFDEYYSQYLYLQQLLFSLTPSSLSPPCKAF